VKLRISDWHYSLLNRTASFILLAVLFAYAVGSAVGFMVVERISREQWALQAEMNAQIATTALRSIYTFISVETNKEGQTVRIITDRPIGDRDSVLSTGFAPNDILALASAQTKHNIWLFQPQSHGFVSLASGLGNPGDTLSYTDPKAMDPRAIAQFYVGFARIGGEEHFISSLPILGPSNELLGLIVSSIGTTASITALRDGLIRNSLLMLLAVLAGTAIIVILVMRRLFRPVPILIQSLLRITYGDIHTATPFRDRRDEIGRLAVAIETLREAIAEREYLRVVKEEAMKLEHMAHHDPLTGLPNRAYLNKTLGNAIATLASGGQFNLMLFDLDRFKEVNDTHGHAIGDALLTAVGDRVVLLLGPEDVAVRLGGDEFAIIQRVARDPIKEGEKLAQRIVETMGTPFIIHELELTIGASVGAANAPRDGDDPHDLMKKADVALYAAKKAGRGVAVFYEAGMAMARADTPML
jgi:diguanylate cyclase (GGDEF)-like protein